MHCVEKGAGVEADMLASLTAVLPPELRDAMPEELRAALGRSGAPAASAPTAYDPPAVNFAPVPAATVAANQIGGSPLSSDHEGFLSLPECSLHWQTQHML